MPSKPISAAPLARASPCRNWRCLEKMQTFRPSAGAEGEGDATTKPAATANKLRLEISERPNVRCIMTSDFLRNQELFAMVRRQVLVVHRIVGESLSFAVKDQLALARPIGDIAQVNQAGAVVADGDVGVRRLAGADAVYEVRLVPLIREVALVLVHYLAVLLKHLPAAPVPAEKHQPLGTEDLDPTRALRPIRPFGSVAHFLGKLRHVWVVRAGLTVHDEVTVVVSDHLQVGGLTLVVEGETPTRAVDRLRVRRGAKRHACEGGLVAGIVGEVAAAVVPISSPRPPQPRCRKRSLRRGALEKIPVNARRHGRRRTLPPWAAATRKQVVHLYQPDLPEFAGLDVVAGGGGV